MKTILPYPGYPVWTVIMVITVTPWLLMGGVSAQSFITEESQVRAEIIIAEDPPRMTALAALELQYYLEKISGARLPITHEPGPEFPVKIYVGESRYTDSLGISCEELKYGAFRMVSGSDWMVLMGQDVDFNPDRYKPWAHAQPQSYINQAWAEWDSLTMENEGRKWWLPFKFVFKNWWHPKEYNSIMSARYGTDNKNIWDPRDLSWSNDYQGPGAGADIWAQDQGGSLNAVYHFLRTLGARWYMPGPTGEEIPEQQSIALPSTDRTVHPDFSIRTYFWYNYGKFSFDDIMWARRLGMHSANEMLGYWIWAHGLKFVHYSSEMKAAHPEYYALINGARDTTHNGYGQACYSSEGLMQETIKFARFWFDYYNEPKVDLWPVDGYRHCQCELCEGKTPSELVWGFVDKVARELYKSHPNRLVSCGAYTPYIYPPDSIERFSPNVMVIIANAGRPGLIDPGRFDSYLENIHGWQEKVDSGRIMRLENNRFSIRYGEYEDPLAFPVIHPHAMAKDLRELKGISIGDCGEESQARTRWWAPGVDHLTLYVQSRFLWDAEQDIDSLLDEYYSRFYGPAAEEMKTAFDFAESKYQCYIDDPVRNRCKIVDPREMDYSIRIHLLELLYTAHDSAGETIYGQRIRTILDELTPLEELRSEVKWVNLVVVDRRTGAPLEGAGVLIGDQSMFTSDSGKSGLYISKGKWGYTIEHSDYFSLTDSVTISVDTSLVIQLTRQNTALVKVVDKATGEPVYRAELSYDENLEASDLSGEATIGFLAGDLDLTVKHRDYFALNEVVTISNDTTIVIALTRKLATIQFRVMDTAGAVEGASISLDSWEIQTGIDGIAKYSNQPARQQYEYSIGHIGYPAVIDTLFLEIDTTVTVFLQFTTGTYTSSLVHPVIYPNPAYGKLHISMGQETATFLLLNPEGKIIKTGKIYGGINTIDVSGIHEGLYILRIQTKHQITHRKVVLE